MRVAACDGKLSPEMAFDADDGFVLAWIVANGENHGATFDWTNLTWGQQ